MSEPADIPATTVWRNGPRVVELRADEDMFGGWLLRTDWKAPFVGSYSRGQGAVTLRCANRDVAATTFRQYAAARQGAGYSIVSTERPERAD